MKNLNRMFDLKWIVASIIYIAIFLYLKSICEYQYFFGLYTWDYLIIISIFLIFNLCKNIYNKIFLYLWLLWFLVGNINMYILYKFVEKYNVIDTRIANHIYLLYLLIFSLVFKLSEFFFYKKYKKVDLSYESYYNNTFMLIILAIFPIVGLIEMYINIGYLPVFANFDITDIMYKLNIGFINSKIGNMGLISAIYFYVKFLECRDKVWKYIYAVIIIVSSFYLIATGVRFRLLIFLICIMLISLRYYNNLKFKNIILVTFGSITVYLVISILRSGGIVNQYNLLENFNSLGGEYRSWAISLETLNGSKLYNYDWLLSSLAAFFGKGLLNLIGFDGDALINMNSARYFSRFFVTINGIRIGIIGELNYQYGNNGLIVFALFGFIFGYINNVILKTRSINKLIFCSCLFALNVLTIMGQSDVYFSSLKGLLYTLVVIAIINLPYQKNSLIQRNRNQMY